MGAGKIKMFIEISFGILIAYYVVFQLFLFQRKKLQENRQCFIECVRSRSHVLIIGIKRKADFPDRRRAAPSGFGFETSGREAARARGGVTGVELSSESCCAAASQNPVAGGCRSSCRYGFSPTRDAVRRQQAHVRDRRQLRADAL